MNFDGDTSIFIPILLNSSGVSIVFKMKYSNNKHYRIIPATRFVVFRGSTRLERRPFFEQLSKSPIADLLCVIRLSSLLAEAAVYKCKKKCISTS